LIGFQTLGSEINFCLYFYWDNLFTCIHNKINFAGTSVIGIIVNAQILDGFKLLANILFC